MIQSPPAPIAPSSDLDRLLSEIPSETSLLERRLLVELFAHVWNGRGAVVEIGPFLGGTTRAIALGMLRNPERKSDAVLHTFDRFGSYYTEQALRQMIDPLVQRAVFTPEQADELCRGADFERLFEAIHSPHDYHRLIRLHNSPMPDLPEEIDGSKALGCLRPLGMLGGVFIDGCKSWASTHYALTFLLPRLPVGAPIAFQDFGWFTCFWISSAVHALRDHLELVTHADSTYVFRLKRAVTAEQVAQFYARTPDEMGEEFFARAAAELYVHSQERGDLRGELIAQLHHVAALVTLDRRAEAARLLNALDVRRYIAFRNMIQGCIKSPTYFPGGRQLLWRTSA